MSCNCKNKRRSPAGPKDERKDNSSSTGKKQTFELRNRDGSTQTFQRKLDAEAARVRNGGGSITVH